MLPRGRKIHGAARLPLSPMTHLDKLVSACIPTQSIFRWGSRHACRLNSTRAEICVLLQSVLPRSTPDTRQLTRKSSNASAGREHGVSLTSQKKERLRQHAPGSDKHLTTLVSLAWRWLHLGLLGTNGLWLRRLHILLLPGGEPFSRSVAVKATGHLRTDIVLSAWILCYTPNNIDGTK
jgi:hypothetical protein